MKLNCKVGDLAVIIRSVAGNEGKIVRCLHLSDSIGVRSPNGSIRETPVWRIDSKLMNHLGNLNNEIADDQLRPIRDQPGEDETLS